jgi:hypothetical protein
MAYDPATYLNNDKNLRIINGETQQFTYFYNDGSTRPAVYGQSAPSSTGLYGGSLQSWGWVTLQPPAPSTPPPVAVPPPPHLQFSAGVIGSPLFLAHGRSKLPGQIIWALGIDASHDVVDTSLLTFAAAYCEPIDPTEAVRIQTMWANGTLFYDYDQGGLLQVANLDSVNQSYLQACIANIEIHTGTETQQPSPTMKSYLGAANVPAYRGLRYIVFSDFPLIVANNSVPNIVVEWRPTSGGLLNVSDEMALLIEHVNLRSESSPVFGIPTITDIDDLCYGVTITDQSSLIDHFAKHRNVYNCQIKEADPIEVVRRAVGSSLVIDVEVDEADLIASNGPAIATNRINPTDFPVGMNLAYIDPDHNYDSKIAPATFDGSQPGRASSTSSSVLSAQSDYVVDATTARSLAFNAMFNLRSYAGRVQIEMNDLRPEVGDTIALTTREGDVYILLVENQTITKQRSNSIQAMQLLTAAGADVNGDGGNDGGVLSKKYWPENVLGPEFIVDTAAGVDRVWSIRDVTSKYVIGMNFMSSPFRKLSTLRWRNMGDNDLAQIEWGASAAYFVQAGPMFEDDFYVYWMPGNALIVSRLLKTADNINGVETMVYPPGFGTSGTNANGTDYNNIYDFKDGKLYIAWNGEWNGAGNDLTNFKLVVVDVAAWDASAVAAYDYYVGADRPYPQALKVTDNGTVVIATRLLGPPNAGRYYYANISDLTTWSNASATFPVWKWASVQHGDKVYFAEEDDTSPGGGEAHRKSRLAVIDVSAGFSESVVDLNVKDPNYLCHSQAALRIMWKSGTHLFIAGNHSNGLGASGYVDGPPFEHRYIGRFDLTPTSSPPTPLDAAGGKYLSELVYNENDFAIQTGKCFDGKVYVSLSTLNVSRLAFLVLSEDLTTEVHYWTNDTTAPSNDNFAARTLLQLDVLQNNDLSYGSTEAAEPVPDYAVTGSADMAFNNGHSVWYEFVAPASTDYTITVTGIGAAPLPMGIAVYTGPDLASLTYEAGAAPPSTGIANAAIFTAVAGTAYKISIRSRDVGSGVGGAIPIRSAGSGKFSILVTGGAPASPPGAPTISAVRPFSAASSSWDIGTGDTTLSNHIRVVGTATPGATIDVYLDGGGSPAASTAADGSGDWDVGIDSLSIASHFVTATQTSGSVVSDPSSAASFTVASNVTSFTSTPSGTFTMDSSTWIVWTAGAGYSLTNPDNFTLRFEVHSGDHASFDSSAVDRSWIERSARLAVNDVFKCTYEVLMESGDSQTAAWFLLGAMHNDDTNDEPPGVHTSPPFAIEMNGEKLQVVIRYTSVGGDPSNGSPDLTTTTLWTDGSDMSRDVWHRIEIEAKTNQAGTGYLKVWVDGTQVVNYSGNLGFGDHVYWEEGIYRDAASSVGEEIAAKFKNVLIVTS